MNACEAAAKDGREGALDAELLALFEAQNASGDAARTEIPAAYLRVEVGVLGGSSNINELRMLADVNAPLDHRLTCWIKIHRSEPTTPPRPRAQACPIPGGYL